MPTNLRKLIQGIDRLINAEPLDGLMEADPDVLRGLDADDRRVALMALETTHKHLEIAGDCARMAWRRIPVEARRVAAGMTARDPIDVDRFLADVAADPALASNPTIDDQRAKPVWSRATAPLDQLHPVSATIERIHREVEDSTIIAREVARSEAPGVTDAERDAHSRLSKAVTMALAHVLTAAGLEPIQATTSTDGTTFEVRITMLDPFGASQPLADVESKLQRSAPATYVARAIEQAIKESATAIALARSTLPDLDSAGPVQRVEPIEPLVVVADESAEERTARAAGVIERNRERAGLPPMSPQGLTDAAIALAADYNLAEVDQTAIYDAIIASDPMLQCAITAKVAAVALDAQLDQAIADGEVREVTIREIDDADPVGGEG